MRTIRSDKNGTRKRIFEKGDGMRRRYRELLDDRHFMFPGTGKVHHRKSWYLDGHLVRNPLMGIYCLANFAEYLLHYAKLGKRNQRHGLCKAAEFFASTRRTMRNILDEFPVDKSLTKLQRARMQDKCRELITQAVEADAAVNGGVMSCRCPACEGRELSVHDARLLATILHRLSSAGTIPPTSGLFVDDTRMTRIISEIGIDK